MAQCCIVNANCIRKASVAVCTFGVIILIVSQLIGKQQLFLYLNANLGIAVDYFLGIFTNAGDGAMWLVVLLLVLYQFKKKHFFPLVLTTFLTSTALVQFCKYVILPNEARPYSAIADKSLIHTVSFITPHEINSFPSGHTATAFCIYLLLTLFIRQSWWLWVGLLYAVLVGYSRIYVAQHFPLDVAAGMLVSVASIWAGLFVQSKVTPDIKNSFRPQLS
jgi:membrane-associated phospholipid phosphatase